MFDYRKVVYGFSSAWNICTASVSRLPPKGAAKVRDRVLALGFSGLAPESNMAGTGKWTIEIGDVPIIYSSYMLHIWFIFKKKKTWKFRDFPHEICDSLVVWTPLKNVSQLGWLFSIYGKIKHVPNHQPGWCSDQKPHESSGIFHMFDCQRVSGDIWI